MRLCFSWESRVPFNSGAHGDISQVAGMLKSLAKRGIEVHFVCLHEGEVNGLCGVHVHQVTPSPNKELNRRMLVSKMVRLHQTNRFDVFHFRSQHLVLEMKKMLPSVPCVYTMVPYYFVTKEEDDFIREKAVIEACDKLTVFTEGWKKYYEATFKESKGKIEHIRVGVDEDFKKNLSHKRNGREWVIGYFGGIREDYGLEELIKALPIINQTLGQKVKILLTGSGHEKYLNKLKQLSTHLGVAHQVDFKGYISKQEVPLYLSTCSVAVNLRYDTTVNKNRGFDYSIPIKVVEYMVVGVPVIGSKDGGMVELLGHDYKFLVNPTEPYEIARALKELLKEEREVNKVVLSNQLKAKPYLNTNVVNDYVRMFLSLK